MLLKSQSMSCLLDAEAPVKHQRSPSHDATIIGKTENVGFNEYHMSFDRLPLVLKRQDRDCMACDQDRTPPPPPILWPRHARTRGMETIECVNQELSRRCHELSLQLQALKDESCFDQRYRQITIQALQGERDTLTNDKQRLLRDCTMLEQKLMELYLHNQTSDVQDVMISNSWTDSTLYSV